MFTGIVTHIGSVRRVQDTSGGVRMEIESDLPAPALETGASVAHDGCCLTVVAAGETETGRRWHALDVSRETLSRTTLGMWREGQAVNLEAAARFGDPIGGHHVLGHVDGCGIVETVEHRGDNLVLEIDAPESLAPFIAEKGSIAVDGISLTVNRIEGARFALNIIPHTGKITTLGGVHPGRRVNLEIDPLARYVARLLSSGHIT
jgi:riboflavin synthase